MTVQSMSVVSLVKLLATTWADCGERGAGGASAMMAKSCLVVREKAGVVGWVGPSLGDSMDMDEWMDIF